MVGIAFILVNDICNAVFWNTYTVIASEKFPKEEFITFQSNSAMCTRCVQIAGAAVVGVMIDVIPDVAIFGIDILTFLVSAMLISKIDYAWKQKDSAGKISGEENIICQIKNAFQFIIQSPIVRGIVILVFGLNLAYGFIPNILPLTLAEQSGNAVLLGSIKSMMALGELFGLLIVNRYGKYISGLFQIAMFCCGICMLSLMVIHNWFLVIVFLLYGVFDAMTQPMFSYMITRIDEKNRGKILGGIDALLLLSPSFGIAIGTKLIAVNYNWAILYLTIIFAGGFLMVTLNRKLNHLKV